MRGAAHISKTQTELKNSNDRVSWRILSALTVWFKELLGCWRKTSLIHRLKQHCVTLRLIVESQSHVVKCRRRPRELRMRLSNQLSALKWHGAALSHFSLTLSLCCLSPEAYVPPQLFYNGKVDYFDLQRLGGLLSHLKKTLKGWCSFQELWTGNKQQSTVKKRSLMCLSD